jgi:5-hydroxyisourate hydrolase
MSAITTHVLDTARGLPAEGVAVLLEEADEEAGAGGWRELGRGTTDADGRVRTLLPEGEPIARGTYRLTFATGAYFAALGMAAFHPEISIVFTVDEPARHHHVPLLVAPFGYTTYRGS